MSGKLYAIGTGPGASDLITVRAARLLAHMDIVYAPAARKGGDSLALSIVREYIGNQTEIKERHFPMSNNAEEKQQAWQAVTDEIVSDITAGKKVAFVSLGDVMLYSTWVSILERLPDGLDIEIIPGITSFALIAAKTKRPLAMETQSLVVMSCTVGKEVLAQALQQHSSLVLMKAASCLPDVKALIEELGLLDYAVLVSDASLTSEKQYRNLKDIPADEKLPYFTTILVNKEWKI
ncbi:cobalt-factor II C(20)-methyltransferase [Entomomonas sp. E2T0]|uniref:cobalt-factor II C(20)-methyltransferase n=1 Tax=Entomomonas sp. E2T0 TaxID=2930213 RepID=UPI0022282C8B|nr:cobalt-factor II C(20)-methyltransferase [Entomomonas sp. E2T0]UYZ82679.1 cobalt-factor II C(20)-methyltransferase [Entomomonas sp. E2T0]